MNNIFLVIALLILTVANYTFGQETPRYDSGNYLALK